MKRLCALPLLWLAWAAPAGAQQLDLSHGGPIAITASNGIEWHQNDQTVIAIGNAHAVRGDVTVVADRLIAFYRKKAAAPGATRVVAQQPPPLGSPPTGLPPVGTTPVGTTPVGTTPVGTTRGSPTDEGDNEIYRLEAIGNVHIYTTTDLAEGDKAVYDMDQPVLVLTGHGLKITTPTDLITARDAMEYWPNQHMAVARGDAVITTNDARQITGDTIVAYLTDPNAPPAPGQSAPGKPAAPAARPGAPPADPLAASGKLQRAEIFGHAVIRTTTQTVRGDRGVYVPDTGLARMAGDTQLTQGQNQVNGQGLEVNLNTGVYRLISQPGQRVEGVVVPNDAGSQAGSQAGSGTPPSSARPAHP